MDDQSYEDAAKEWLKNFDLWRAGKHRYQDENLKYYWEYEDAPNRESHAEDYGTEDERTWYQMYETVSEGTPCTPPFATKQELIDHLVEHGDSLVFRKYAHGPYSHEAAEAFVELGSVPSMVMHKGRVYENLETACIPNSDD